MSELNDLAKFISEATGEPCEVDDILHVKRAKEPLDGSPLESVVQPQQEGGVASNPNVQPAAIRKIIKKIEARMRKANRRHSEAMQDDAETKQWLDGVFSGLQMARSIVGDALEEARNTD